VGGDLRPHLKSPADTRGFFARESAGFHPSVRTLFSAIEADSFVFVDTITMVRRMAVERGPAVLRGADVGRQRSRVI
jgi:hypothetical protein